MNSLKSDSTTPPIFVALAIAGGVLFLLGGVLTAMTPDDRGVLLVGMIAFLLLGVYTLLLAVRHNRLIEENRQLTEAVERAQGRDRALRARLAITIREPLATVVSFADRLADERDLAGDERDAMLVELRTSAQEVDRALADVSAADDAAANPRVFGVVRLDEELASVAASTISGIDFESWLEPARAWGDPASVRQALRTVLTAIQSEGCTKVVLKADSRGDRVTATLSGKCGLVSAPGLQVLTDRSAEVPDDDWHQALRSAHDAITAMGGSIAATEALGVSHVIVELPAAPEEIRATPPRPRPPQNLPVLGAPASAMGAMMVAADLRPERPTASLRFD